MRQVLGHVTRTGPCGKYWAMQHVVGHSASTGPCTYVLGHVARTKPCGKYWTICRVRGYVALIQERINVYRILVEKSKETDNLEELR